MNHFGCACGGALIAIVACVFAAWLKERMGEGKDAA